MKLFLRHLSVLTLTVAMLAACVNTSPPVKVEGMPVKASITPGETITVHGNENIYAVARERNVSMRETIVLNNLQPPYLLKPGQELVLPARPGEKAGTVAPPPDAAPNGDIERQSLAPIQASPLPPVAGSPSSASGPITPATVAAIGAAKPGAVSLPPPAAPAVPIPATDTVLNAPVSPPKPVVATTVAPAAAALVPAAPVIAAPATTTSLVWPVQGPVISGYGPKPGGLNNDGVNIAAPKGAPVAAAGNGIVVYAGNEMKGFGNLILVRHQSGLVTAYAHLDRMLVAKDATVAQGDMIGTVGKTGDVPSPQLHFEVRRDGKPIDPTSLVKTP